MHGLSTQKHSDTKKTKAILTPKGKFRTNNTDYWNSVDRNLQYLETSRDLFLNLKRSMKTDW